MKPESYRLQDGCWNCKRLGVHFGTGDEEQDVCTIDTRGTGRVSVDYVSEHGICDYHTKEAD